MIFGNDKFRECFPLKYLTNVLGFSFAGDGVQGFKQNDLVEFGNSLWTESNLGAQSNVSGRGESH